MDRFQSKGEIEIDKDKDKETVKERERERERMSQSYVQKISEGAIGVQKVLTDRRTKLIGKSAVAPQNMRIQKEIIVI